MSRAYFSRKVFESGVAVSGAVITVVDSVSNESIDLYDTETTETVAASITSNSDGRFSFWSEQGTYNITATSGSQSDSWLYQSVANRPSHELIDLDSVTSATIIESGTGVYYADVVAMRVGGITTISGSFSNFTQDDDVDIDISSYVSSIYSIKITRKDSGSTADIPATNTGTTITINRNDDISGSSPFYFSFIGESL